MAYLLDILKNSALQKAVINSRYLQLGQNMVQIFSVLDDINHND